MAVQIPCFLRSRFCVYRKPLADCMWGHESLQVCSAGGQHELRVDLEHSVINWQVAQSVFSADRRLYALAFKAHIHWLHSFIMCPQKTFELWSERCLHFCWAGAWPFFSFLCILKVQNTAILLPPNQIPSLSSSFPVATLLLLPVSTSARANCRGQREAVLLCSKHS